MCAGNSLDVGQQTNAAVNNSTFPQSGILWHDSSRRCYRKTIEKGLQILLGWPIKLILIFPNILEKNL